MEERNVRIIPDIPFFMCGAQCIMVVAESTLDDEIKQVCPAYAEWHRKTPQQPSDDDVHDAEKPSLESDLPARVWETPQSVLQTCPLFPLAVYRLPDAEPTTIQQAFAYVYTGKKWTTAVYPLQGNDVTPLAAVRFTRAVLHTLPVGTPPPLPTNTQHPAQWHEGIITSARKALTRKHPTAVAYTATNAFETPPASIAPPPQVFLCEPPDSNAWARAARVDAPLLQDTFLGHTLFALDATCKTLQDIQARATATTDGA
eukprot:3858223-Rhodomonas_salina.2